MSGSLDDRAAAILDAAIAAYERDLDFDAMPSQGDVAAALGVGKRTVYELPAWKAYWQWRQELPLPPCRVCGEPSDVRARHLCHTHHERWRRWGKPEPWQAWADACRKERLNTCEMCGVQFNGSQGVVRFCDPCRKQRKRRQALDHWHQRTPAERREAIERSKRQARERSERRKVLVTCRICGKQWRDHEHRTLCSDDCRAEAINRSRREIRRRTRLVELLQQHDDITRRLADDDAEEG